jgi:hypothetical protein
MSPPAHPSHTPSWIPLINIFFIILKRKQNHKHDLPLFLLLNFSPLV